MATKRTVRRSSKGFTLVEILIVVIILGILAAIVIPQFTNASSDARNSSLSSQLQTVRSQIELYKIQHNDTLPNLVTDWTQLTGYTDSSGTAWGGGSTGTKYGPYLQQTPANPLNNLTSVVNGTTAPGSAAGFVYDYAAGAGTGKILGTAANGTTLTSY